MLKNVNILALSAIASVTILSLTALILVLDGRFDSSWNQNNGFSITIEKQQTSTNINDCLPVEENSHLSDCDNQ